jgi:chlorite dismutase
MLVTFVGGGSGPWRIVRNEPVRGEGLPTASQLEVVERGRPPGGTWTLRGVVSYERYVNTSEQSELRERSPALGRPTATNAALIPIRKSDSWWALPQDERRAIFEERSRHIATGLRYVPAIARRLHHGRDLGEPFDFLTWFEYAPADATAFEDLVGMLRETEEWRYVVREVDVRLLLDPTTH